MPKPGGDKPDNKKRRQPATVSLGELFDDCTICQAMEGAAKEGRSLGEEELRRLLTGRPRLVRAWPGLCGRRVKWVMTGWKRPSFLIVTGELCRQSIFRLNLQDFPG